MKLAIKIVNQHSRAKEDISQAVDIRQHCGLPALRKRLQNGIKRKLQPVSTLECFTTIHLRVQRVHLRASCYARAVSPLVVEYTVIIALERKLTTVNCQQIAQ